MKLGVLANSAHPMLDDVVEELRLHAAELGMDIVAESPLAERFGFEDSLDDLDDADAHIDTLLTLGGDGTLLRGARIAGPRGIPVLGCNLGRLGFLTAGARTDLEDLLRRLADSDYLEEPRVALQINVPAAATSYYALNDAVVHQTGVARLIRLHVQVDGEEVGQYSADGIVISSATGSTAYSLSAGGPILVPSLDALVATPICPHTLAIRPLVVPSSSVITVEVLSKAGARVSADGQAGQILDRGDLVEVRSAEHPVRLLRMRGQGFFAVLSEKLRWGDVRPVWESP